MLRKILITCTAILAAAALTACGGNNKQEEPQTTPEQTTEAATTQAPTTPTQPTTTQPETTKEAEIEAPEGLVQPDEYLGEAFTGVVVSDGEGLTLRLGPGTDFEGFDNIPDDTELTIEAEQDGWGFTSYQDQYGWVFLEFVA